MKDLEKYAEKLSYLYDSSPDTEEELSSEFNLSTSRYTDKTYIAEGGMKKVSKVTDNHTKRELAYAEPLNSDDATCEAFLREARLTAMLDHPNIIKVHDIGLENTGKPFLTMDLKIGQSLSELVASVIAGKSGLSDNRLFEIFIKVCDAISYAHSKKILHLDLKPDNIQIGTHGEVIVCDWGLGKIIGEPEKESLINQTERQKLINSTLYGEIKGTPGFMSPEHINPSEKKNEQTDIFSLGCVLYYLKTLEAPFSGSNINETLQKTLSSKICLNSRKIDKSLSHIITKCLAQYKDDRYKNVDELKQDIVLYMNGFPPKAENAGLFKKSLLWAKRNSMVVQLSFAAGLLIAIISLFYSAKIQQSLKNEISSRALAAEKELEAERNLKKLKNTLDSEYLSMNNHFIYHEPEKSVSLALEKINRSLAYKFEIKTFAQKVYTLFLSQRYRDLLDSVQELKKRDLKLYHETLEADLVNDLIDLSSKYANIKPDYEILSPQNFFSLIQDLPRKRAYLIEKIIAFDLSIRKEKLDYFPAIQEVLRKTKQKADIEKISYHKESGTLIFKSSNIYALNNRQSGLTILRFLDVKHANFSGSKLKRIYDLKGLDFETLNIKNTRVKDLESLQNFKNLKELIIGKNQFTKEELSLINPSVKIKYR